MATMLTIGDFSRMTHLSVKALRHYHDLGVLEPAAVDPFTGYRSYDTSQVGSAQVIRRLRDLGMPLDSIAAVLAAPDLEARNREIASHLARMERQLEQTQASVAALRALLTGPAIRPEIKLRAIPAVTALAVRQVVDAADLTEWGGGAFDALAQALTAHRADRRRPVRRPVPGRLLRAGAERDNGLPPGHAGRRPSGRGRPRTRPGACGCWRSPPSRRRSRSTRARSASSTGPTARSARWWPSAPSA